ncbi:hypothetical protein [Lapidilactobacillus dextrinicus]|nr:hypothetical protein [Lapidilactobacillus dextrinicus]
MTNTITANATWFKKYSAQLVVVYYHPYNGSFCHAILESIQKA